MPETHSTAANTPGEDTMRGPTQPEVAAPGGVEVCDLSALAAAEGCDLAADPSPVYARLTGAGPVHRVRIPGVEGACWLITGHEQACAALLDTRFSNDIRHSAAWTDDGGHAVGRNMLQSDAPQHTRLRRLVAGEFTARRVEGMRPRVQRLTDALVDALAHQPQVDLVEALALPLPLAVICELMGVPETDRAAFHRWSSETVDPGSPEAGAAAAAAMSGYFTELFALKRAGGDDDLLGALVRASDRAASAAEGRLTEEELLGMAFLLLVAGHETTVNLLSGGVLALLQHPEQFEALRADWSLLDGAVEEMLRWTAPVQTSAFRFTTTSVTVGGTEIPAGEPVLIGLAAASRAEELLPRAAEFDIHRPISQSRAHVAFGHGAHHCLGAPLARMEARTAIRTLLQRCPGLRLAEQPPSWRSHMLLRGPRTLPVLTGA
ncbi:cytochrome P450 [Streptomyces sp. 549]|uniref:cytochrome P450 family protein n=1 Tax=Streptomyces sp. 549 TaxID=3049076 RepID=UPI0024C20FA8|nr:cytochrome P450 [Streptomyces sp. 549]MDK1475326.1 cytochrome P450 [Streptomyces sp. 549]